MDAIGYEHGRFRGMSNPEVWYYARGLLDRLKTFDPFIDPFTREKPGSGYLLHLEELRVFMPVLMDRMADLDPKVKAFRELVDFGPKR